MKISLNWIKEYTEIKVTNEQLIEKIGSQIGAVESVEDYGDKYKSALIVKVISCEDHPNADRLHVCLIDDGKAANNVNRDDKGYVQVVCGAPNIATGQNVVWLPPGATVPETFEFPKPFVLDVRLIRDVLSSGMIASEKELALGDDESGILVINDDIKPGTLIAEHFGLSDCIIDIENKMFTHRPDCFGILGVAREIAGIQHLKFTSPSWYTKADLPANLDTARLPLTIRNELPDLVPRFMAVAMSGIKIKPSSVQLQSYLTRLGIRPICNVVDITNYLMLLTSQPMHAYDYDKVLALDQGAKYATLTARYPKKDEELLLLNGKIIQPKEGTIMIATDTEAIGLAGIMGGGDTEVDENTKNIILESATFDMYAIRKAAMANGVFTDSATRYTKGQSPFQNDKVLAKAIDMVKELAEGVIASPVIDDHHLPTVASVTAGVDFINERLGLNLDSGQIAQLLTNVEFTVKNEGDAVIVKPPFWRTDIAIAEDIIEEVGRLYGYDHLPRELPKRDLTPAEHNPLLVLKSQIRRILSAAGANEILTYSFVHGNLIAKAGQDTAKAFQLGNAISPDLQYFRLSLLPSLLDKTYPNIKSGYQKFAIFEIGKAHIKDWLDDERLPKEENRLALVFAADKSVAETYDGAAYYQAKCYLENLADNLGIDLSYGLLPDEAHLQVNQQMASLFSKERGAVVMEAASGELIGVIGEFKPAVSKVFKLPVYCSGFEVDVNKLLKFSRTGMYQALSKYPKVEQDISLKVDSLLTYGQLETALKSAVEKLKPSSCNYKIQPVDIFQRDDDKSHKQVTFRLIISSYETTLKAEEVNKMLDQAANELKHQFQVERI